jgi:uncharacterized membrane protein (DUF485 family)
VKQELIEKIKNNSEYQKLVAKRRRFGWTLTAAMLVVYFGFVLMIAFVPDVLSRPLFRDGITSLGVVLGIDVIMCAFVLSGVYVWRANSEFDTLTHNIKNAIKDSL